MSVLKKCGIGHVFSIFEVEICGFRHVSASLFFCPEIENIPNGMFLAQKCVSEKNLISTISERAEQPDLRKSFF